MNIALTSLRDIDLTEYINALNPQLILTSTYKSQDLKLADLALQLDEKIHLENNKIDLICVVNQLNLNTLAVKNFTTDYIDRIYYSTNNLHTSSFYCKSEVFSLIGSLYKIDYERYAFKNLEQDTIELLTEKIFYIANRLGIEIKYAQS